MFGAISLILCTIAIGTSYIWEPTVPKDMRPVWDWVHSLDQDQMKFLFRKGNTILKDLELDGILKYRHQLRPGWIAVIFAIITPLGFAVNAQFVFFLTSEMNFDAQQIKKWQFSAATVMSFITLTVAAVFWQFNPDSYYFSFNWNLFWWGLGGSIINILGIVSL